MHTQAAKFLLKNATPEARQWPCFLAPTGAGKTARAAEVARDLGLPLEVLLPGTALPEDILGLPQTVRGRTVWTLPEWAARAAKEPVLIFIDELDKARPETHGALLTLMSGLEVRGHKLHPDTRILAAMQPVDRAEWLSTETGRALSARLVFLTLSYDRARHAKAWGLDAASLDALFGVEPEPVPPVLPVISDRQVSALTHFLSVARKEERDLLPIIVRGMVGERADAVLKAWGERTALSPQAVVAAIVEDPSIVHGLSVQEAVALAPIALIEGTPKAWAAIMHHIGMRGTLEDWQAAVKSFYQAVEDAAGGKDRVTIFRADPSSEEETLQAVVEEAIALAKVVKDREEKEGK